MVAWPDARSSLKLEPQKQRRATEWLRRGIAERWARLPHQAVIEFVAAVGRSLPGGPLLSPEEALRHAEDLLHQFPVLYPNEEILRLALRGAVAYRLSWFDAHLWAYAEHYGLEELHSEDFEHERRYGTVTAINPFLVD